MCPSCAPNCAGAQVSDDYKPAARHGPSRCVSLVSAAPPCQPVHICDNYALDHVDVTFTVQTESYDRLHVPKEITTSDNRTCTIAGDFEGCK